MSLPALLATLFFGGLVGLVSGLVGVGGGILMVPLLYALFTLPDWSGILVPHLDQAVVAHATSLFVIVPTALAGLLAYHKARLVAWRVALPMAAAAVLAALAGVQVAVRLPPEVLKASFGVFLMASGANLVRGNAAGQSAVPEPRLTLRLAVVSGLLVGFITSLLGVGGGIVAIPILIHFVRLDVKKVAATSLGVVVFSALVAAVTFAVSGWGRGGLPPGSLGYIFVPAGLALMPGAVLMAGVGVHINRRMDARTLKRIFGVLFLLVGTRLFLGNIGAVLG